MIKRTERLGGRGTYLISPPQIAFWNAGELEQSEKLWSLHGRQEPPFLRRTVSRCTELDQTEQIYLLLRHTPGHHRPVLEKENLRFGCSCVEFTSLLRRFLCIPAFLFLPQLWNPQQIPGGAPRSRRLCIRGNPVPRTRRPERIRRVYAFIDEFGVRVIRRLSCIEKLGWHDS